jgi:hypothetical protein
MALISDTRPISTDLPSSPDPDGIICHEPRGVIHLDEDFGLCYALELPCGVPEELEAQRFREENGLYQNYAVKLQGTAPAANKTSTTSNGPRLSNEELRLGILIFLNGGLF